MQKFLEMLIQDVATEAAKGIGAGLRGFFKNSILITGLILLLAGSVYANWTLLQVNAADRREYKAEIKEYADALKATNRLLLETQASQAICMAEQNRLAAEIIDLKYQVKILKNKH